MSSRAYIIKDASSTGPVEDYGGYGPADSERLVVFTPDAVSPTTTSFATAPDPAP